MRANLMMLALSVLTLGALQAQNGNPFELLWRLDSAGMAEAVIPVPEPEPVPPPKEITPEILPEQQPVAQPDTTIQTIDEIIDDTTALVDATPRENAGNIFEPPDAVEDSSEVTEMPLISKEKHPESVAEVVEVIEEQVPEEIASGHGTLVLVLLFALIFALLAWVLSLNRDLLRKVYRAALNENYAALLFREQRFATTQYLYYIIYFVFFLTGGLFLYLIGQQFGWQAWVFRSVWSCIGLITVVYLLRHLCLNILGSTYPVTKETTQFSFSILLHNVLLGVCLIPVTLFLAFGPDSLDKGIAIAGIGICGIVYLLRQFRGLIIGGSLVGSNFLHFFVYLCAVEILPLVTLVKFFQQ